MTKKAKKQERDLHPSMLKIARKLESIRKERGYTSYENFAVEFGISRMQYWRMEKGTNFQFESLLKILEAHEMSLAEFFMDFD